VVVCQYCNAELYWVQEEHKNMGAWTYVQPRTQTAVGGYHRYIFILYNWQYAFFYHHSPFYE